MTEWFPRHRDGEYMTLFGKTMGQIFWSRHYFLTKRSDIHFFRKSQGFGVSAQVLRRLRECRIPTIVILWEHPDDTATKLTARVEDFYAHGVTWQDRESDFQKVLALGLFSQSTLNEFQEVHT